MSYNPITIGKAWLIASNPTPEQKDLSIKRYSICLDCEYYKKSRPITHDEYCSVCLCPISKKIFSDNFNECPKGKWESVDIEFESIVKKEHPVEKTKKTIL